MMNTRAEVSAENLEAFPQGLQFSFEMCQSAVYQLALSRGQSHFWRPILHRIVNSSSRLTAVLLPRIVACLAGNLHERHGRLQINLEKFCPGAIQLFA